MQGLGWMLFLCAADRVEGVAEPSLRVHEDWSKKMSGFGHCHATSILAQCDDCGQEPLLAFQTRPCRSLHFDVPPKVCHVRVT